jgi:hypothetical protein
MANLFDGRGLFIGLSEADQKNLSDVDFERYKHVSESAERARSLQVQVRALEVQVKEASDELKAATAALGKPLTVTDLAKDIIASNRKLRGL